MSIPSNIPEHHANWLKIHPDRTYEWFKEMLKQGFDVHHLDGNHYNNDPINLALIEHCDHMRLHNANINRMSVRHSYRQKKVWEVTTYCGNFIITLKKGESGRNACRKFSLGNEEVIARSRRK